MKTPHDIVMENFDFPYAFRPFQIEDTDAAAEVPAFGNYADPGLGKTAQALAVSAYLKHEMGTDRMIVTTPPVVFESWARSIKAITEKRYGKPRPYMFYRGTPAQRAKLRDQWSDAEIVIMTNDILKRDYEHVGNFVDDFSPCFAIDEAHAIKNYQSDTHKAVKGITAGLPVNLLTGSPTLKPEDCYGYMRFTNPNAYRNFSHFLRCHVADEDAYGNAKEYKDLDLLQKNFLHNAVRRRKRDHLKDLPQVQYIPIFYDLESAHVKLYNDLAEQRLLEVENGEAIDALSTSRLTHALQQIVVNYDHFSGNPMKESNSLRIVEEVLDEIGDEKLLVVGVYRMTNDLLIKKFAHVNAVAIYGGMSNTQRDEALNRFVNDPKCRMLVIQPRAGGVGLDGLQHVCSEMLFLECHSTPMEFWQSTGRLDRGGQSSTVNCRIAVANKTLQVRRHRQLLENDEMVVQLEGGTQDLRKMIYGE